MTLAIFFICKVKFDTRVGPISKEIILEVWKKNFCLIFLAHRGFRRKNKTSGTTDFAEFFWLFLPGNISRILPSEHPVSHRKKGEPNKSRLNFAKRDTPQVLIFTQKNYTGALISQKICCLACCFQFLIPKKPIKIFACGPRVPQKVTLCPVQIFIWQNQDHSQHGFRRKKQTSGTTDFAEFQNITWNLHHGFRRILPPN